MIDRCECSFLHCAAPAEFERVEALGGATSVPLDLVAERVDAGEWRPLCRYHATMESAPSTLSVVVSVVRPIQRGGERS